MADAVTSRTLLDGPVNLVRHLTNISDNTGESAVTKVDVSTFANIAPGEPCTEVAIRRIAYRTQGMSVQLLWDASTDDVAAVLPENSSDDHVYDPPLVNPKSSGWTGDIKLTTAGQSNGDTYDILIEMEKR